MAEYYHLRLSPPANAHEIRHCSCLAVPAERHGSLVSDPGGDLGRILQVVEREGLKLEQILVTHGHIDHAGGVADDRLWIDAMPQQSRMFGFSDVRSFVPSL